MRIIRSAALIPVSWKNGGGITREIAGVTDHLGPLWRLSLADIDRDGPFSAFPGFHRILTVVAGEGLVLDLPDGPRRVARLCPIAFDGAVPVAARLPKGAVRALNVMCRKDVIASVATLSGATRHVVAAGPGETIAIHVVADGAIGNGTGLEPGDTVLCAAGTFDLPPGGEAVCISIAHRPAAPAAK
ncbi:HutD family protein [Albidovulum sp.]|uniref:HutD/Ves family protein n=1 Tax=Albidovulum sp. TaxID=1872424 RepID=UPI0039B99223